MTIFTIQPINKHELASVESSIESPSLSACRARFTLGTDFPLDPGMFPGPALRGLIGRGLERLGSPAASAFLHQRFLSSAADSPVPWRMAFSSPPEMDAALFEVEITTFGPAASADLSAITATLEMPGLRLDLLRTSFHIRLHDCTPQEACVISLSEQTAELCRWPVEASSHTTLYLLTPLIINTHGHRLPAATLAKDTRPLLDSLRLRFADLAGIRRKHPLLVAFPHALPPTRTSLQDAQLRLPLQGTGQSLTGIIGVLEWAMLPPSVTSLLEVATWLGAGRSTTYGAGTLHLDFEQ